jgi:hypothetical protein
MDSESFAREERGSTMKQNKLINILWIVLALQAVVIAVGNWRSRELAPVSASEKLLEISKDQIEWLKIKDLEGRELTLRKEKSGWVVPAKFDFPVDSTKLSGVLDSVLEFKKGYAVGKSAVSAKQFRVTNEDFERKLEFGAAGDKPLSTVIFGSSPAFKQVHVRVNDGPTYLAEYTVFNLGIEPRDWLNFSLLNTDEKDIKRVVINDVVVESSKRKDGTGVDLLVAGATSEDNYDPEKVKELVTDAASPIFKDVLAKKGAEEFAALPKILEWQIETATNTISYVVQGPLPKEKDAYALTASDRDYVFKVSQKDLDRLKELKLASLKAEAKEVAAVAK